MNEAGKSKGVQDDELHLLRAVERFYLILLALLTGGSWVICDWPFARSVFIGGALAGGSFFWLKRTAMRFAHHAAVGGASGADGQINDKSFSTGFAVKSAARLFVLAFLLLLFSTLFSMNVIGLVIGLSTVMLSVIIVVLVRG
ncbi:MAG: hypothetical protein D3906_04150 [Candidatus Electrothrix sp. AUS1_2]|nr:hypothetical protein [Candidatus Electrothrix sp. AUS1_2]